MSDDEPTRLVRRAIASPKDEETKVFGNPRSSGRSRPSNQPETRIASGIDDENAEEEGDVYELTVGWLVVISGPGRGASREVLFGMNSIGRAPDQRIPLDFGDENISRESHAFIVYDDQQQDFYVQHGGKANLVRHNGKPVLSPIELNHGDIIELGNTKLMFVPLCSDSFNWSDKEHA